MSVKFFCDVCSSICNAVTTRRWENIIGELGLEIILLKKNNPTGLVHVCDSCIFDLFWKKLNQESNTRLEEIKSKVNTLDYREQIISDREDKCVEIEQKLKFKDRDLQTREDEIKRLEASVGQLKEAEKLIQAQLNQLRTREYEIIRQSEQRGYQRAVDEHEYSTYTDAIQRNQFMRGG